MILGFFDILKRFLFTRNDKNLLTIYKTRNTGTGNEMRGMQGTPRVFTRIPGNLLEDSAEPYHPNILGNVREVPDNVREDSGNVPEDSGESKFRFILGNLACFL